MRGTAQLSGRHTVDISDAGITVVPRLESTLGRPLQSAPRRTNERVNFGIPALDDMLRGGLPAATMTAVAGPPGTGKSTLALHFLNAAVHKGEPAIYFGLYDSEEVILARSERFGMLLHTEKGRELVRVMEQQPVEGCIDMFVDRILTMVRRTGARRLCIDGSQGFEIAADTPHRLREVFCALDQELTGLGVSTLYTMETQPFFGRDVSLPSTGMSASTQNIVLLTHLPQSDRIAKAISVLKVRDSAHDSCIREFDITDRGIELRPRTTERPAP
jgi:circadian clock protein KaiC